MKPTIIIFLFLISTASVDAQNLFNKSILSIGPSSIVYVKDTLINQGTIINNGEAEIGGSWINNGQYDAGQGQIIFNSDLPQVINHNDQSFSRLTISGGGEKIFLADITIEKELDLADGILVSQNNSRIIFSENAEVSGGSDDSYVQGPVYHLGAGDKIFPIGSGSYYLPVTITNIQGAAAEVGIRAIELNGTSLQASATLQAISTNRYWELDVVSGSVSNSVVVLPVRNEQIVNSKDEIVVAESETLTGNFRSLGQLKFEGDATDGKVYADKPVTQSLLAVGTATPDDGSIIVYNAVSANDDRLNDFLYIKNIDRFPENKVSIFSRWGDKVFEIENYDNADRVFKGKSNINGEKSLVNGTYFYVIETRNGRLKVNGFLALRN
jgi:gliding motility-associated-like protein